VLKIGILASTLALQLASGVGWASIAAIGGSLFYYMGLAHTTKYYHYGLLVDKGTGWDIYGYPF
jgi:hypothetical protein